MSFSSSGDQKVGGGEGAEIERERKKEEKTVKVTEKHHQF